MFRLNFQSHRAVPCFHLANKRILSPIIWAGYTHQRFLTILKGGATPADCTRPCGYARCICPSSFASVTSSFAFAAEDKLSRFSLLLFRACPHCTRLSFVCQALFSVAFKRYTVGTSRSCCCVSRLTRLDCTRLLIDCQALFLWCRSVALPTVTSVPHRWCICQALFSVATGWAAALSLTGKAIVPQPGTLVNPFSKKNSG